VRLVRFVIDLLGYYCFPSEDSKANVQNTSGSIPNRKKAEEKNVSLLPSMSPSSSLSSSMMMMIMMTFIRRRLLHGRDIKRN
jgi:hypothetical protein